jgi:membrane associated rhomboid family serine protease
MSTTGLKKEKVNIDPPEAKPIITVLMICALPLFVATKNINWVEQIAFTPLKFAELLATGQYSELFLYMGKATLAQVSPWIWLINSLFIWVFGYVLEKKLKAWRYPVFLIIAMIASWTAVYATAGFNQSKMYVGPSMLLFAMLGGYFAFFPKKPFKPQQWLRPNTEIFRDDKPTPINERYWVSPWMYVSAFILYQIILQIFLNFPKDVLISKTHIDALGLIQQTLVGRMQVQPSAFSPLAAGVALAAGALFAQILPKFGISLKPKRPGGKLQLEVIQHYRELRTLDMTHEQACEGAAKFAAVPIDIAKDWIAKGAAGLRDQEIK